MKELNESQKEIFNQLVELRKETKKCNSEKIKEKINSSILACEWELMKSLNFRSYLNLIKSSYIFSMY